MFSFFFFKTCTNAMFPSKPFADI